MGACIGTVIAEFTVTCVQIYFVRKSFSIFRILKTSIKYMFSAIVMFIVSIIVGRIIKFKILAICLQVLISGLCYAICLIILKDKFVFEILNNLKNKYKVKVNINGKS